MIWRDTIEKVCLFVCSTFALLVERSRRGPCLFCPLVQPQGAERHTHKEQRCKRRRVLTAVVASCSHDDWAEGMKPLFLASGGESECESCQTDRTIPWPPHCRATHKTMQLERTFLLLRSSCSLSLVCLPSCPARPRYLWVTLERRGARQTATTTTTTTILQESGRERGSLSLSL